MDEAYIVKVMYDLLLAGNTIGSIASYLNKMNFKTRKSKHFTKQTVEFILRNEANTGTYTFNKMNRKKHSKTLLLKDYREVKKIHQYPSIVSQDVYDKAINILDNRKNTRCNNRNHIYLLRGILKCGICGKTFIGCSNSGGQKRQKRFYYRCPEHEYSCKTKNINADYIEKLVVNLVVNQVNKLDLSTEFQEVINDELKLINSNKCNLEKKYNQLKKDLMNKLTLLNDETLSEDVKNTIREFVEELNNDMKEIKKNFDEFDNIIIKLSNIDSKIDVDTLMQNRILARDLISNCIDSIIVSDDDIQINLK